MVCTIKHFVKICLPPVLSSVRNLKMMDESTHNSWRSSVVEQLTCNQQVGGSNPFASSRGEVAEWTKAADCKSAGVSLRRFESFPPHHCENNNDEIATESTEIKEEKDVFLFSVISVANALMMRLPQGAQR